MPSKYLSAGLVAAALAVSAPVQASDSIGELGNPRVAYTAEQVYRLGDRQMLIKEFHVPGMTRISRTLNGIEQVVICRHDRGVAYVVIPVLRMYTKVPMESAGLLPAGFSPTATLPKASAADQIGGETAQRYDIVRTADDPSAAFGSIWLNQHGLIVKTVAEASDGKPEMVMELRNIRYEAPDLALFEVPAGYMRLGEFEAIPQTQEAGRASPFDVVQNLSD